MAYQIRLIPEAVKDLRRLDKPVAQRVVNKLKWLSQSFEDIVPEPLVGGFKTLYKLKIGSSIEFYTR